METLLKHASTIYLVDYFGLIVVVSLLECIIPRRPASEYLKMRWLGNIGIAILDTVIIRVFFPVLTLGMAALSADRGWGLFNRVHLPLWFQVLVVVMAIDLSNYCQHYLLHRVPLFWRFHRAHHTDQDYDFTTALRFHPIEAILTTAGTVGVVAALGAPLIAVFASQLLTMSQNFIGHGNFRIPARVDRALRLIFVMPSTHQIHHSRDIRQSQSNLANAFSWWDRLFRTYMDPSKTTPETLVFGVDEFLDPKHLTLHWMLAQPFLRERAVVNDPQCRNEKPTGPNFG